MARHTLFLEPDYDFVLIGISSHAKDYRICWAINNKLNIEFKKIDSLEIKNSKKQSTPSFFSTFRFEDAENFLEYFVIANLSEGKRPSLKKNSLFGEEKEEEQSLENECLIPEYKNFDYFFIIKGKVSDNKRDEFVTAIKELDITLTALAINLTPLKSKQNLIF